MTFPELSCSIDHTKRLRGLETVYHNRLRDVLPEIDPYDSGLELVFYRAAQALSNLLASDISEKSLIQAEKRAGKILVRAREKLERGECDDEYEELLVGAQISLAGAHQLEVASYQNHIVAAEASQAIPMIGVALTCMYNPLTVAACLAACGYIDDPMEADSGDSDLSIDADLPDNGAPEPLNNPFDDLAHCDLLIEGEIVSGIQCADIELIQDFIRVQEAPFDLQNYLDVAENDDTESLIFLVQSGVYDIDSVVVPENSSLRQITIIGVGDVTFNGSFNFVNSLVHINLKNLRLNAQATGESVLRVNGAQEVRLDQVSLEQGRWGLDLSDIDSLRVTNSRIFENTEGGLQLNNVRFAEFKRSRPDEVETGVGIENNNGTAVSIRTDEEERSEIFMDRVVITGHRKNQGRRPESTAVFYIEGAVDLAARVTFTNNEASFATLLTAKSLDDRAPQVLLRDPINFNNEVPFLGMAFSAETCFVGEFPDEERRGRSGWLNINWAHYQLNGDEIEIVDINNLERHQRLTIGNCNFPESFRSF